MRIEVAWLEELDAMRGKYGRYGADTSDVAELSL